MTLKHTTAAERAAMERETARRIAEVDAKIARNRPAPTKRSGSGDGHGSIGNTDNSKRGRGLGPGGRPA